MALKNQPYLPLYIKDFITHEKLNECSAASNGVYIRLMCLMHKNEHYGTIELKAKYEQIESKAEAYSMQLSKQMPFDRDIIHAGLTELLEEKVIYIDGNRLCQKRMIKDGDLSAVRAEAGSQKGKSKKQASTVNESESESTDEINIIKKEPPSLVEFLAYGDTLCTETGQSFIALKFAIESKYQTWLDDKWRDGHGTHIANWKNKLRNTFPHLKAIGKANGKETRREKHIRNSQGE